MKIMYVSKIDCKYLWSTISETKDECESKTKLLITSEEKYRCTVAQLETYTVDTFLLL